MAKSSGPTPEKTNVPHLPLVCPRACADERARGMYSGRWVCNGRRQRSRLQTAKRAVSRKATPSYILSWFGYRIEPRHFDILSPADRGVGWHQSIGENEFLWILYEKSTVFLFFSPSFATNFDQAKGLIVVATNYCSFFSGWTPACSTEGREPTLGSIPGGRTGAGTDGPDLKNPNLFGPKSGFTVPLLGPNIGLIVELVSFFGPNLGTNLELVSLFGPHLGPNLG